MQLIETTVSGDSVRLLYADGASKDEPAEWLEFQVSLEGDGNRRLGVIHREALRRVQELIDSETQRLRELSNQLGDKLL